MNSPKRPPCISDSQEIQHLAKHVLVNRLFLGSYQERRYVDVLRDYRDVVVISPAETQLQSDLEKVRGKMLKFYGVKWVGVTDPDFPGAPAGHCLWVKIKNLPFGQYWFQIRQVKFEDGEVLLRLKSIRPVSSQDQLPPSKSTSNTESQSDTSIPEPPDSSNEYHFDFDPGEAISSMWKNVKETSQKVIPLLTKQNLILVLKLTVALLIALITVMLAFVRNLGEYFLRLLREVTLFINVSTPIILQCIDLVTKSIGGLYILLAMMWRGQPVNRPPRPYPNQPLMLPPSAKKIPPPADWRERNRLLKEQLLNR